MRKIIYICSLLFLYAVATYAQNTTVTIGSVLASTAGQKITVPINVTNFNDVGSVTLFIQYDATAVTYDSSNAGSEYLINASGGQIAIARAELTAATPVNGKLFDLIFTYHSGASPMAFTAASQLSSTNGVVIPGVVFSSGGIFPPTTPSISIGDTTVTTVNSKIAIPLRVSNFTDVGSVTLHIQYDPAVVRFDSSSRASEFLANPEGGVINIARAELAAVTPTSGELLKMYFTFLGGNTALVFTGGNQVSNTSGVTIPNVIFANGSVSGPAPIVTSVTLGTVAAAALNAEVTVPVTVTNFTDVGSVTMHIQYDPAVATFDSVSHGSEYLANAEGGILSIARAELTAATPANGQLINLYFKYHGGTSALTFTGVNQFTTTGSVVLNGVVLNNGSITPGPGAITKVSLGNVTAATVNGDISVPLNVQNFNNVGSVTWHIQYDPAVAHFDSVTNASQYLANAEAGVINIARAELTAAVPDSGLLLTVHFTYLGGNTNLTFTGANQVSDLNGVTINGVVYTNGSITGTGGATVDIGDVFASTINSKVTVPINVTNFNDIGSVTFHIAYNPAVARFDSVSKSSEYLANANAGVLSIARAELNAVTPDSGTILNMYFTYLGGNTDLTFTGTNLVTNIASVPVNVTYIDGFIRNNATLISVSIDSVRAGQVNQEVVVPVNVTNFANVGSVTWKIQFDPAVAVFDSVSRGSEFLAHADTNGVITVARAEIAAVTPSTGKIFDIYFKYLGGATDVSFIANQQLVTDINSATVAGIVYENGHISLNHAPVFVQVLNIGNTPVRDTLRFQYIATDPDGDIVTYSLRTPPAGASITSDGLLTYVPQQDKINVTITVIASDPFGGTATSTKVLRITEVLSNLELPKAFALTQNYPNPFNPTTSIQFSVPKESFVTLKIYNILGQEVATLVNELLPANNYRYSFDASHLSSGVYIYKLQAGDFVSTKKMTLMK